MNRTPDSSESTRGDHRDDRVRTSFPKSSSDLGSIGWSEEDIKDLVTEDFLRASLPLKSHIFLETDLVYHEDLTDDTYLDWILARCRKLFLVLNEIGLPEHIFKVVDEFVDDLDLPFLAQDLKELKLPKTSLEEAFLRAQFKYVVQTPLEQEFECDVIDLLDEYPESRDDRLSTEPRSDFRYAYENLKCLPARTRLLEENASAELEADARDRVSALACFRASNADEARRQSSTWIPEVAEIPSRPDSPLEWDDRFYTVSNELSSAEDMTRQQSRSTNQGDCRTWSASLNGSEPETSPVIIAKQLRDQDGDASNKKTVELPKTFTDSDGFSGIQLSGLEHVRANTCGSAPESVSRNISAKHDLISKRPLPIETISSRKHSQEKGETQIYQSWTSQFIYFAIHMRNRLEVGVRQLSEPIRPPRTQRIRWQCKCGHRSFDDFVELRPGALAEYETMLRQRYQDKSSPRRSRSSFPSISSFFNDLHKQITRNDREQELPRHSNRQIPTSTTHSGPITLCSTILHVLLSLPYCSRGSKLYQPSLMNVNSDRAFFHLLARSYQTSRSRLKRLLSLKTIRSIKFVQLEMYRSKVVDIRKVDSIPPAEDDAYIYDPKPPDLIPPVGENLMMHLLAHPEDADERDMVALKRVPKKNNVLAACPVRGTGLGWGIHFVEGWCFGYFWFFTLLLAVLGSLVFLVCWAVLKQDLQGASGVAGYILAVSTVLMGTLQVAIEMEVL